MGYFIAGIIALLFFLLKGGSSTQVIPSTGSGVVSPVTGATLSPSNYATIGNVAQPAAVLNPVVSTPVVNATPIATRLNVVQAPVAPVYKTAIGVTQVIKPPVTPIVYTAPTRVTSGVTGGTLGYRGGYRVL